MTTAHSSGRGYADLLDPEGADAAKRNDEVRRAWGEWLDGHEWDRFITLTFPARTSVAAAQRRFDAWIAHVQDRAGHDVPWFRITEHLPYHAQHIHAVLNRSGELADALLQRLWGKGRCDFEVYDRRRGGTYYITKYVARHDTDYDVSTGLWTPCEGYRPATN